MELQLKDSQMRMEQQKQMHDQMVKCLGVLQQPSFSSIDVSKSITDATQSAMVNQLERELEALRAQSAERENQLNSKIEDQREQILDLKKENEAMLLDHKDSESKLRQ